MFVRAFSLALCSTAISAAQPVLAELPPPVRAMIDAAIAKGDEAKVRTVVELARETNPDDSAELDAILAAYDAELALAKKREDEARREEIRTAGLFENWHGKGELGAFRSSGNSSSSGVTAALTLNREGIDWRHKLTARADYQRTNGVTSREQWLARYEPNYNISDKLFAYALAQFERDRFQGFAARYAVSGGVGYQVVNYPDLKLSAKLGPAYRVTEFNSGQTENRIAGLFGVDFDWDITDRLKLTQDANAVAESGGSALVIVDSGNTSVNLITGLNAKISEKFGARLSYAVDYNSNPPAGAVQTDTLSRVTLIYDF